MHRRCRTGRDAGTATITNHLFQNGDRCTPDLWPENDRKFRAGVTTFLAFRAIVCQTGFVDESLLVPGMVFGRPQAARFAGLRTLAAESAATAGKINLRIVAPAINQNVFRTGLDTFSTIVAVPNER